MFPPGHVAAVTGGARGLGRTIVSSLAQAGADVAILVREPAAAADVVAQARALGRRVEALRCDVEDEQLVAGAASATLALFGHVDTLVCNSGISGPTKNLWETEPSDWWEAVRVNLFGAFLCCRAFLPAMVGRGSGSIVLVGSMTGKRPLPGRSGYAASKLGLVGLARTLAAEAGPFGVRVNVVSPGPIAGERIEGVLELQAELTGTTVEGARQRMLAGNCLGRFVSPEQVAAAVGFLASDAAASVTGEDMNVSAGTVMY